MINALFGLKNDPEFRDCDFILHSSKVYILGDCAG